jgi:hypothetical protein
MEYKLIDASKTEEVARLAICLTNEIIERTGTKHFDVDISSAIYLCNDFINTGHYYVVAALDNDDVVGFGALCESRCWSSTISATDRSLKSE